MFIDANPSADLMANFAGETILAVVQVEAPWGSQLRDTGRVIEMQGTKILAIAGKKPDENFPIGELRITGRAIWTEAFWKNHDNSEVSTLRKLASEQKLSSTIVKTKYIDVGNPEGYNYAQEIFNR